MVLKFCVIANPVMGRGGMNNLDPSKSVNKRQIQSRNLGQLFWCHRMLKKHNAEWD